MNIISVGYNHFHDADFNIARPDGSGDYLMLLLKTPAIFNIDGKEIKAEPNTAFLYNIGTPQYYHACGSQFGNDWFQFMITEEEKKLLSALQIPFDTIMPTDSIEELSILVNMISYETYSSNTYRTDSVELLVKLFFIKLSEKIHMDCCGGSSQYQEKMSNLRAKLYNMPYNEWNIDGMAHELTMSKSSFQHMYKEIFGISPMNDVIKSRTEHGKYLLTSTDYTILHISKMCGYKSYIHFLRQFKQNTGLTPSEYREQKKH